MNRYPGDAVPANMPEDLGRVHAALGTRADAAPDALLQRILVSRAAGERVILPVDHSRPSRLRQRLVRGAIAAVLGFVVLATASRSWRAHREVATATASLGFSMGDDFGFATIAAAQGAAVPRFAPMTFDAARLHPVRLRYVKRIFIDGKATDPSGERLDPDTLDVTLSRAPGHGDWLVATERSFLSNMNTVRVHEVDTVSLDGVTLAPRSDLHDVHASDGNGGTLRWTIGDSTVALHVVQRDVHVRAVIDTLITATDTLLSLPRTGYPIVLGGGAELAAKLMAVPFGPTWKASVVVARPEGIIVRPGVVRYAIPLDLEVVGEEPAASPHGMVDCWVVRRVGDAEYTYRIRKSDGVLLSLHIASKFQGRMDLLDMVLVGEQ